MFQPQDRRAVYLRRSSVCLLIALACLLLLLGAACGSTTSASAGASTAATPTPEEARVATPRTGGDAATKPTPRTAPAAKPTAHTGSARVAPTSSQAASSRSGRAADSTSDTAIDADRERIAATATWAPGQLEAHFEKHGSEGGARSAAEYDAAAREAIRSGTAFTYHDRESDAERLGFYAKAANRFTGVTRDGRRITTSFRPDRGEAYVRGLDGSTYR